MVRSSNDLANDPRYRAMDWNGMPILFCIGIQAQSPDDNPYDCQMVYGCENCDLPYVHWLCDEATWEQLPAILHDKQLCLECFAWFHHGKESSNATGRPCMLQWLVDAAATTAAKR